MTYILIALLVALIVSVAAVQNAVLTQVSFLAWHLQAPLAVVIFASAAAGAVIVISVSVLRQLLSKIREQQLRARIGSLETELREVRNRISTQAVGSPNDQRCAS